MRDTLRTHLHPDEYQVCQDCLHALAYGVESLRDSDTDPARIIEIGLAVSDVEREGFTLWPLGGDAWAPFSSAPCDLCGSALGGERWTAARSVRIDAVEYLPDGPCTWCGIEAPRLFRYGTKRRGSMYWGDALCGRGCHDDACSEAFTVEAVEQ